MHRATSIVRTICAGGLITDRTAIVHDWFQGYHGSERVVDAMRTGLFAAGNQPAIFTFHAAHDVLPPDLSSAIVRESRLAALPGIRQRGHDPGRWRYLLPCMPHYFSGLNLEEYDLVISSSHACAVNVRTSPSAIHVCYCYTPMRYAWMRETEQDRARGIRGLALRALAARLRRIDLEASARPHAYAAISTAVRDRIDRFYGRQAEVIHPPVDVNEFDPAAPKEPGAFLWVNRLVPYKLPDLVAEAFRGLPYRLTMIGIGPLSAHLRASLPANVELRDWVSRDELISLYAQSSGFVHVGEEDFGITMVEALASGTPVIGLDRGGARDIVRHGRDGILIEDARVEPLRDAIARVAREEWSRDSLVTRAHEFSREKFLARFREFVSEVGARRPAAGRVG